MLTIKLSSNENSPEEAFREALNYANLHQIIVVFEYDDEVYNIYPCSPGEKAIVITELLKHQIDLEVAELRQQEQDEFDRELTSIMRDDEYDWQQQRANSYD